MQLSGYSPIGQQYQNGQPSPQAPPQQHQQRQQQPMSQIPLQNVTQPDQLSFGSNGSSVMPGNEMMGAPAQTLNYIDMNAFATDLPPNAGFDLGSSGNFSPASFLGDASFGRSLPQKPMKQPIQQQASIQPQHQSQLQPFPNVMSTPQRQQQIQPFSQGQHPQFQHSSPLQQLPNNDFSYLSHLSQPSPPVPTSQQPVTQQQSPYQGLPVTGHHRSSFSTPPTNSPRSRIPSHAAISPHSQFPSQHQQFQAQHHHHQQHQPFQKFQLQQLQQSPHQPPQSQQYQNHAFSPYSHSPSQYQTNIPNASNANSFPSTSQGPLTSQPDWNNFTRQNNQQTPSIQGQTPSQGHPQSPAQVPVPLESTQQWQAQQWQFNSAQSVQQPMQTIQPQSLYQQPPRENGHRASFDGATIQPSNLQKGFQNPIPNQNHPQVPLMPWESQPQQTPSPTPISFSEKYGSQATITPPQQDVPIPSQKSIDDPPQLEEVATIDFQDPTPQPQQLPSHVPKPRSTPISTTPIPLPDNIPKSFIQIPNQKTYASSSLQPVPSTPKNSQKTILPAKIATPKVQTNSTVLASPSVTKSSISTQKSPSVASRNGVSKKSHSPSTSTKARLAHPPSLYVHVAEECISQAYQISHCVVLEGSTDSLHEYQKLMATAFTCLETALRMGKLSPRQDAKLRLRYAALLCEETDNVMEAETTLSKGITQCDRHRFQDLKYMMQYALIKVLFQRNHKAALKALDRHIADTTTLQHPHWVYAFRLLKLSFYYRLGTMADLPSLENMRAANTLAQERHDDAMVIILSLLEALILLKTGCYENLPRIQECLSRSSTHQNQLGVAIPQLELFQLCIDLLATIPGKNIDLTLQKLQHSLKRMEDPEVREAWPSTTTEFLVPVRKHSTAVRYVSHETSALLQPGTEEDDHDYIVFSFAARAEFHILLFTYSGLIYSTRSNVVSCNALSAFDESLDTMNRWSSTASSALSLQSATQHGQWQVETKCYTLLLSGLYLASRSCWNRVKRNLEELQRLVSPFSHRKMREMMLYLTGVYYQGTGQLELALTVFEDELFRLDTNQTSRSFTTHLPLLAAMNIVWIRQHPGFKNEPQTNALLEELRILCVDHPDIEIQIAYSITLAPIQRNPPLLLNEVKNLLHVSISGAKRTGNTHFLALSLTLMRNRLFEGVVGEQALRSAQAASAQASRSGNLLWMSVADALLAQYYEVLGEAKEALHMNNMVRKHTFQALAGYPDLPPNHQRPLSQS